MNGIRPASDEVKKLGSEKIAQVRIYNLHLMAQIIDLAITRGAFRGAEASQVGALFDILAGAVNKAYDIAEDEINKVSEIKLPSISEEKISQTS
jgi:hypothetical protein